MKTDQPKRREAVSATLRVRYFVMDLPYHNHNPNVRIPAIFSTF